MKSIYALCFAAPLALFAQQQVSKDKSAPSELPPSAIDKSTIVIQPKARADDLVKAYEMFKKEKPTYRISARLANGQILGNLIELTPMPNGTLFVVKSTTAIGTNTQVFSVDEIIDFFYP